MLRLSKSTTALLLAVVLVMVGCPQQTTLAALTTTLGNSAAQIAVLEGNTPLAQKLEADTAAAAAAITSWKSGTVSQNVIAALNIVEDDLNLIPGTSQYAPLIILAIGTIQSIVAIVSPPAAAIRGRVRLTAPAPKNSAQFKARWNTIVAANPQLAPAAIK